MNIWGYELQEQEKGKRDLMLFFKNSIYTKHTFPEPVGTQLAITCLKLSIKILEQGVKYVQRYQ